MSILDDNTVVSHGNTSGLSVSAEMKRNWMTTSKWAMFFAIVGFVYIGFNLLSIGSMAATFRMLATMSSNPFIDAIGPMVPYITVFSLLMMVVVFMICFYHLRFSSQLKKAVNFTDQLAFEQAWMNLRNHFRLYGITVCVVLAMYLIMAVFFVSMMASAVQQYPE
jgi:hypothetical protein